MSQDKILKYKFDDFSLDLKTETLNHGGIAMPLTPKAWQVLLILVQNANQIVVKDEIYARLWSDSFVEEANLTQYIYLLRKSFSEISKGQKSYIETITRQGYRFNGQVSEVFVVENDENIAAEKDNEFIVAARAEDSEAGANQSENDFVIKNGFDAAAGVGKEGNGSKPFSIPNSNSQNAHSKPFISFNYARWIGKIVASSLIIIAAVFLYRSYISVPTAADSINSLAILPFTIVGAENADDKMGLGMADAVITRLSKLQVIPVRPTSAIFRYTDRPAENSVAAGRELNVDSVLEGTVQHDEKNVRVSIRLIKVADGKTLWAENFDGKFGDIFSVQDLISSQIAETLSLKLTKEQEQILTERETISTEAFHSFQLGNYFWNRRGKEDLQKSVEYFQRATALDPKYARAYAALADSFAMLGYHNFADANEMSEKATLNAMVALKLNSDLAEPYIALAVVDILKKDYWQAQEKIERAVALAPYNSSAHHRYAVILLLNRKLDESVAQMRLAQAYDSLSPTINKALCNALIYQSNHSEAVPYCEKALEIAPDAPGARRLLAYAYFLNKRYDEAFETINLELQSGRSNNSTRLVLAYFYIKTGRRAEAEEIYAELKTKLPKTPLIVVDLSILGYALGKSEETLKHYEKMLELIDSEPEYRIFFAYDEIWDEIKSDPNFERVYQQSNFSL